MKHPILCALILLLGINSLDAQTHIQVTELRDQLLDGEQTTLFVAPVGYYPDIIKKSYSKYCKERLQLKPQHKKSTLMVVKSIDNPIIGNTMGDLKATILTIDGQLKVGLCYRLGYHLSVNSTDNPEESEKIRDFLKKYVVYHESIYFQQMLEENTRRLKELIKSLQESQKEIKTLSKRIEKIEHKISKEQDEDEKFDLDTENYANRARVQAVNDIITNLKTEILKFNSAAEKAKSDLIQLEGQVY